MMRVPVSVQHVSTRVIILSCLPTRSWFYSKQSDKNFSGLRKASLHNRPALPMLLGDTPNGDRPVGLPMRMPILLLEQDQ